MPSPKHHDIISCFARGKSGLLAAVFAQLGSVFIFMLSVASLRSYGPGAVIVTGFILSVVSTSTFALLAWRVLRLEKEKAQSVATSAMEFQRVEEFLRKNAHDLRNSLASVLTGSEVLLAVYASPDTRPLLQSIGRQANVIAGIADRLVEELHPSNGTSASHTTTEPKLTMQDSIETTCERTAPIGKTVLKSPLRILAIDDRRDVLLPLRILLTKAGHEFAEAEDGPTGLEKVATFRPQIVLCDINLPGKLSGLDVARSIRNQLGLDSTYLVAISGNFQSIDLEESAKAGFDYRIAKPVTADALRNLIANRPSFKIEDRQQRAAFEQGH